MRIFKFYANFAKNSYFRPILTVETIFSEICIFLEAIFSQIHLPYLCEGKRFFDKNLGLPFFEVLFPNPQKNFREKISLGVFDHLAYDFCDFQKP